MADDECQQLENLKIADRFYMALHDLVGYEYEVRKDQKSIYIYHSDRNIRKKATSDCILHAMYGVMLSSDVRSIYVDGFGELTLTTLKHHIRLKLCNGK